MIDLIIDFVLGLVLGYIVATAIIGIIKYRRIEIDKKLEKELQDTLK